MTGPAVIEHPVGAEQFFAWARAVAGALNVESWSATERLLVWNEFKRIVEREAFARA